MTAILSPSATSVSEPFRSTQQPYAWAASRAERACGRRPPSPRFQAGAELSGVGCDHCRGAPPRQCPRPGEVREGVGVEEDRRSTSRRIPSTSRRPSSPTPIPGPTTSADVLGELQNLLQRRGGHAPSSPSGTPWTSASVSSRSTGGAEPPRSRGYAAARPLRAPDDHHWGAGRVAGASDDEQGTRGVLVRGLGRARDLPLSESASVHTSEDSTSASGGMPMSAATSPACSRPGDTTPLPSPRARTP